MGSIFPWSDPLMGRMLCRVNSERKVESDEKSESSAGIQNFAFDEARILEWVPCGQYGTYRV